MFKTVFLQLCIMTPQRSKLIDSSNQCHFNPPYSSSQTVIHFHQRRTKELAKTRDK